ncbi:MAG: 30S ribosomal protein S17 [Spirochaetota bacterium]
MSDAEAGLNENTKRKRILTGVVASDKMDKTIVVQVASRKLHRLYKKYVNMSKKFKAHDENNEASVGDRVRVIESKPYSREKRWRLLEIVERAR